MRSPSSPKYSMSVSGRTLASGENDGIARAPLQKLAQRTQHVVLLNGFFHPRTLHRDYERHGVHAKSYDAKLNPKSHDFQDFRLDVRIRGVQIGLKIVEAVEIPRARGLVVRPGRFLYSRKHHSLVAVGRLLIGPNIPVAIFRVGITARVLKPRMPIRGVIDHEIHNDANAALLGSVRELDEIAQRAVARIYP